MNNPNEDVDSSMQCIVYMICGVTIFILFFL